MATFLIGGVQELVLGQGDTNDYFRSLWGGQHTTSDTTLSPDRETLLDAAISGASVRGFCSVNNNSGNVHLRTMKNQAQSSPSATLLFEATGEFSGSGGTPFASGDDWSMRLNATELGHGESVTLDWWTFAYTATGDSTWISSGGEMDHDVASTIVPHGGDESSTSTLFWTTAVATTIDNVRAVVDQNNAAARTLTSAINGVAGNISISIGENTTGLISDTSNSDSLSIDDEYKYDITTGTSMSGDTTNIFGVSARSSVDAYTAIATGPLPITLNSSTRYFPVVPSTLEFLDTSTESEADLVTDFAETVDRGQCTVTSNTRSNSTAITLRDDGVDTNIVISITSSTTGHFIDSSNSHTFVANDLINWKIVTGSGTALCDVVYFSFDIPQTVPPVSTRRIFIT